MRVSAPTSPGNTNHRNATFGPQAAGLTERDTLTIRARLGTTVRNARDLALLLVGRDLLARASELVSVTVEDLEPTEDGVLVKLRRRKTTTGDPSVLYRA